MLQKVVSAQNQFDIREMKRHGCLYNCYNIFMVITKRLFEALSLQKIAFLHIKLRLPDQRRYDIQVSK